MYSKITAAKPAQCSLANKITESAMKIYRVLLFFHLKDLNLSEKRGSSATNKYEKTNVTANKKNAFPVQTDRK